MTPSQTNILTSSPVEIFEHENNNIIKQKVTVFALNEDDVEQEEEIVVGEKNNLSKEYKWNIIWRNVIISGTIHLLGIYGLLLLPFANIYTIYFMFLLITLAQIGSQAGAHRFWSHRSFKANYGVRWFLSICHVLAFQKDAFEWGKEHCQC